MSILQIIYSPNPLLKKISDPVKEVNNEIRELMDNMLQTMYSNKGIGLAAVQVGILKRVIVMDVSYELDKTPHHDHSSCSGVHVKNCQPIFMANPKIIQFSEEESSYNEGCLSFPSAYSDVKRPSEVTVNFLDYQGKEANLKMSGILATCVQHEIDHLDVITFVDHISKLKREIILKKMQKFK